MRLRASPLLFALCIFALALTARAQVTHTDLQVAARALSFSSSPPAGKVRIGILYSATSERSRDQAAQVERLLGAGLKAGSIELVGEMVEIGTARSSDVDIFFLTQHVGDAAASSAALESLRDRFCVTVDMRAVERGACTLGVRSTPKVEIVVNRAAANESGLRFATAFRVLIKEI